LPVKEKNLQCVTYNLLNISNDYNMKIFTSKTKIFAFKGEEPVMKYMNIVII